MFLDNSFVKKMFNCFDKLFGVDSYRYLNRLRGKAAEKRFSSESPPSQESSLALQKKTDELLKNRQNIKLHLGCGKVRLDGYINIDLRQTSATDLECDISRLPFPDETIESIATYHVIEHLPRHDVPKALKEWYRVLSGGGKLIIECPNFDEAVREYLEGNESRIDNIFGHQRFDGDTHLFGYNPKRLKHMLQEAGFKEPIESQPQDYHKDLEPCMRIEASK